MVLYSYECLNKQGDIVKGEINAEDINQALEKLRGMGLSVIDLAESAPKKKNSFFTMEKKVTLGELALFSRQLSSMLSAGIPVTRALFTLSRQVENPTLKKALESIVHDVESGMNLTDAFGAHPNVFSDLYISMIRSGETGGMLEKSLVRLSEQLQKEKILREEVRSALSYPRTIGIFAIVIFIAMLVFLVPIFQGFLPQTANTPAITRFVFDLSNSIRTHYYIWIGAITVIAIGISAFAKSQKGHDLWEHFKLRAPVFGPLILKSVIARFARTLATLLDGGIPVVQALESAGPTSGSDIVADTVKLAARRIEEGKSIASTLEENSVFPPVVTHMIAVGEESGTLPALLDKIAEFYEQEVETGTKSLQSHIQPIALILIGILIGGMLISLYLPIFTALTEVGY